MINGTCNYGSEKCWFNHSNFKNSNETESNENVNNENGNNENENEIDANEAVIEKLFQMMEKFTKQIMEMKERNNLKWESKMTKWWQIHMKNMKAIRDKNNVKKIDNLKMLRPSD